MSWTLQEASSIGGRSEQQDRSLILASTDNRQHLLVVADGAGGHLLGGQAAQIATDTIREQAPQLWASDDPLTSLENLCHLTHQAVCALTNGQGLACTTIVILLVRESDAYWAHVGDSKLHLIRDRKCFLTTTDHSLLQLHRDQQAEDAAETTLEAGTIPSNQLYMCLGAPIELEPAIDAGHLQSGDLILLSSDGFWGQVDLPAVFLSSDSIVHDPTWAQHWVEKARARGGDKSDNITLLAARYTADPRPSGSLLAKIRDFFANFMN